MIPLIKIREADVLMTGAFPSLPDNQLALWKTVENMVFYDARVEKLQGVDVQATAESSIVALTQADVAGVDRVFYGVAAKLYKFEGGIQSIIGSGYTGTQWSMEPWGAWLIATNDVDPVQVWKNTGLADDLTDYFSRAKIVKKLGNHVLFFNTSIDGKEVRWTSKSNAELLEPDTDNSAGGTPVRDLDSDIVAAEYLGDGIGFYSNNAYGIVRYIGGSFIFSVVKMLDGFGAAGKDAVVQVSNEHFGFSPTPGIFRNNGVSATFIHSPAVGKWLKAEYDPVYGEQVRGVHYQSKELIIWSFRAKDATMKQIGYHYTTGAWTLGAQNITAFDESVVEGAGQPLVAIGSSWGYFDADGSLAASLTTNALDGGEVNRWKKWDMLRLRHELVGDVSVRFGFAEHPDAAPEWTDFVPLEIDNWIDREAIYLFVDFSMDEDAAFAVAGFEVFGSLTGMDR